MDFQDRILYHQIHPLKLLADWGFGLLALYFAWQQQLGLASIIALAPSVLATLYLIQFADLTKQKESAFGRYIAKYMGSKIQQTRLFGYGLMFLGAFLQNLLALALGFLLIVFAWTRGWLQERYWPSRSK
jgi:hypothetical protein